MPTARAAEGNENVQAEAFGLIHLLATDVVEAARGYPNSSAVFSAVGYGKGSSPKRESLIPLTRRLVVFSRNFPRVLLPGNRAPPLPPRAPRRLLIRTAGY
ncbi:hypothetical protein EVAR_47656_1 [Eumeta japonica]|uniref:Uncharacterized protein n=1 Tax=Eumeta variegata TaxID=151549 RepID=A0A4C1XZJ4_EUMVA|nr:hypothetical protein EVAR_47656_1 [Eumeta japonica]